MIDVRQITDLHRDMVVRWHSQEIDNPYHGFLALVCQQFSFNFQLWHEEDIARSREVSDAQIADVKRNIDRFNQQSDHIRSPDYNETLIRIDFINPLMSALGWDIDNRQGFAEQYRDQSLTINFNDSTRVSGRAGSGYFGVILPHSRIRTRSSNCSIRRNSSAFLI